MKKHRSGDTKHVQNVFEVFDSNLYINFTIELLEKVCVFRCYYSRDFRPRSVNFNHPIARDLSDKIKFEKSKAFYSYR